MKNVLTKINSPLISIIIPNYNGEKYILRCLDSIVKQKYKNIEIIIVDDGSTDNSVNMIKKYKEDNNLKNMSLICQNNLNAAIARNEGIKNATGDYVIFIDSDDILKENILNDIFMNIVNKSYDLIIGNYDIIDTNEHIIDQKQFFYEKKEYNKNEIYDNLLKINPVPSNKIYNLRIIKKYNIFWGNVKIGQDLNFYLKFLLKCQSVISIPNTMYKYRIVNGSMSRKYNFNIFDISNSFDDIKKFYIMNNSEKLYDTYLQVIELSHYYSQILKAKYFKTIKEKKLVIDFFSIKEKRINYSVCKNYNSYYKRIKLKFLIIKHLKYIYFITNSKLDNYIFNLLFKKR